MIDVIRLVALTEIGDPPVNVSMLGTVPPALALQPKA